MLGALKVITAAALLLRLAGIAREVLPGSGLLVLLLAALHGISYAATQPRSRNWQEIARRYAFAIGLLAICGLALAVRLPSFAADLGRTPLDIDEHRFASSVKHYFVKGELLHSTVEHYPGAVFWLFSAASFLSFLRGLVGGAVTPINAVPVERFVEAARFANILAGMATVAVTGLLGRRLAGTAAGLLSAGLLAVVPLAIDSTVFARNDPGMVLAVCATTLAALIYFDTKRLWWIVGAGASAGIAGAIRVPQLCSHSCPWRSPASPALLRGNECGHS